MAALALRPDDRRSMDLSVHSRVARPHPALLQALVLARLAVSDRALRPATIAPPAHVDLVADGCSLGAGRVLARLLSVLSQQDGLPRPSGRAGKPVVQRAILSQNATGSQPGDSGLPL